ncbi:MSC_0622 family F1-like ATPase gamma subunit [Mycoplasma simbae]|uniref:MSC_0622 family F1-like ATPase gamma subunit n=1 Tax=Mycoplasma simbae TaxID=36744 RepID=UPI00049676C2|nr:F0F1 ATP synthase subunit gamma [Mycoplasma simbae]
MHFKKIEQKKDSLANIFMRVNNDKNILLINIMKLNKKLQFYVNNALTSKNLILGLKKEYNVKNNFINNKGLKDTKIGQKFVKFFTKRKQLWIYLTEEQKHSTDSYTRYEKMILEKTSKTKSDFIVIGSRAQEFAASHNLNIIKSFSEEQKTPGLADELTFLIKFLYVDELYESVHFVISTNKNFRNGFTILPLESFDVNKLTNLAEKIEQTNIREYEIYPDLEQFIDNEINIFLSNAIHSLIIESYFYNAKNNLISTNQIIKQLDEEILKLNKKIIKFKREKEIEDIVMFFRKNKEKAGKTNEQ